MTKNTVLSRLIEQEKLLYLEVEQMRYSLYLHDSSLIFGFFSAFYFAGQDIKHLFIKPNFKQISLLEVKKKSIASLIKKRKWLTLLRYTPYAWIIYGLSLAKQIFLSFRFRLGRERNLASKSGRKKVHKSFIIFGTTDITDLQSRSVQIAIALSKKYKVIYIEGIFNEGRKPGYQVVSESDKFIALRLSARKSIHLNYQKPSLKEIVFLKKSFKFLTLDFPTCLPAGRLSDFQTYIHHPFWATVFQFKKNTYLFDHPENYSQYLNASTHIINSEKKILKNAFLVTAPHKNLLRRNNSSSHSRGGGNPVSNFQLKKSHDLVVNNAVEWSLFKDTSKMIQTCDVGLCWIKKPVMGYIGTLDEKIDEKLLGHLASAFPTASIVLVGNTDYRPVIEVAERYPNIFPVGKQPYNKLPLFLQSFDILIAPFNYTKLHTTVHPELPLYLASGKPIIASASLTYEVVYGPLHLSNKYLYLPKTQSDWVLSISEALKEKKRSTKRILRIAAAKKFVWKTPTF